VGDGPVSGGWHWVEARATRIKPVVLDLDNDGVDLTSATVSPGFDFFQTGEAKTTGWFNGGDALLVYDGNQNGTVDNGLEISFLHHSPGASTDLEALRVFDTNANGLLDQGDAQFLNFRLWQDHNFNGRSDAGELSPLSSLGVQSIGLFGTGGGYQIAGNDIYGVSGFTRTDGSSGNAYDVGFEAFSRGSRLDSENSLWAILHLETDERVAVVKPGRGALTISDLAIYEANGITPEGFQFGSGNDDVRTASWGSDRSFYLDGGDGDDTINLSSSAFGSVIKGGAGSDYLTGSRGNDYIAPGSGYYNLIVDNAGDDYYIFDPSEHNNVYDYGGTDVAIANGYSLDELRFYLRGSDIVMEALDLTLQVTFKNMRNDPATGIEYVMLDDRTITRDELNAFADAGGNYDSQAPLESSVYPDMIYYDRPYSGMGDLSPNLVIV